MRNWKRKRWRMAPRALMTELGRYLRHDAAKDMSLPVINPDTILGDTVKIAKVTGIGDDGEKI